MEDDDLLTRLTEKEITYSGSDSEIDDGNLYSQGSPGQRSLPPHLRGLEPSFPIVDKEPDSVDDESEKDEPVLTEENA